MIQRFSGTCGSLNLNKFGTHFVQICVVVQDYIATESKVKYVSNWSLPPLYFVFFFIFINRKCPLWLSGITAKLTFFTTHGERIAQKLEMGFPSVQSSLFKNSGLDNSTPCTEVSRSRTQLQIEPSTFGSKNVIWLHSLDKQKSDLTRWTNNRDERQTTDLWVTPTDKGSASLGRNMNALHINKILVALTQNKRCLVLMLCTWTRYPIVHVYCGFQLYTHLEAKISNFPILITIFENQKWWAWPSCLDTIENLFQDVYIGYNPWAQINLL